LSSEGVSTQSQTHFVEAGSLKEAEPSFAALGSRILKVVMKGRVKAAQAVVSVRMDLLDYPKDFAKPSMGISFRVVA
jgi:hypothetical protein